MSTQVERVAGVDVGGAKKGFHAVAFQGRVLSAKLTTCSAAAIVAWCREHKVSAIGIDAPSRWSLTGRARSCERELAHAGMSTFSTPSRSVGEIHPFYGWMVNGIALYRGLTSHFPLYEGQSPVVEPFCFETFPQAIACSLTGKKLSAAFKRSDRRRLLEADGIAADGLLNIDEIDAALCALSARHVLAGSFNAYGDGAEGFILVPTRLTSFSACITTADGSLHFLSPS